MEEVCDRQLLLHGDDCNSIRPYVAVCYGFLGLCCISAFCAAAKVLKHRWNTKRKLTAAVTASGMISFAILLLSIRVSARTLRSLAVLGSLTDEVLKNVTEIYLSAVMGMLCVTSCLNVSFQWTEIGMTHDLRKTNNVTRLKPVILVAGTAYVTTSVVSMIATGGSTTIFLLLSMFAALSLSLTFFFGSIFFATKLNNQTKMVRSRISYSSTATAPHQGGEKLRAVTSSNCFSVSFSNNNQKKAASKMVIKDQKRRRKSSSIGNTSSTTKLLKVLKDARHFSSISATTTSKATTDFLHYHRISNKVLNCARDVGVYLFLYIVFAALVIWAQFDPASGPLLFVFSIVKDIAIAAVLVRLLFYLAAGSKILCGTFFYSISTVFFSSIIFLLQLLLLNSKKKMKVFPKEEKEGGGGESKNEQVSSSSTTKKQDLEEDIFSSASTNC